MSTTQVNCQSCGTPFKGKYCFSCGEKQRSPKDFSIRSFIAQAIDIFTHFDGKFFNTFRALLFSPGKLTNEFITGRRVKYMKPLQLYLVIGLAFFFFLKDWDIFYGRLQHQVLGNYGKELNPSQPNELKGYALWKKNVLVARAKKEQIPFSQKVISIDNKLPDTSKALAFLMIPWLGLSLYMVGFMKYRQYVPHLVHATHLFCFFLVTSLIWLEGYEIYCRIFNSEINGWIALAPVGIIFIPYLFLSMRRVLTENVFNGTLKFLIVMTMGFSLMIFLYRELMTLVAVYLL
ncbi:MAG: DUF3667 domain-containing protein [Sphingobacteriales bacterium]|nr:MAG: DUF3667 domain-containing protein [Sphingobacteriales bacterium]